jgi:hypothetical protein
MLYCRLGVPACIASRHPRTVFGSSRVPKGGARGPKRREFSRVVADISWGRTLGAKLLGQAFGPRFGAKPIAALRDRGRAIGPREGKPGRHHDARRGHDLIPIPLRSVEVQTQFRFEQGRSTMSGSRYSPVTIREVWQREGQQRWDGQTHGRGACLLIVEMLRDALTPGRPSVPSRSFEFWRDQNKIRGRFIGDIVGNGVVVGKLDKNGLPLPK